ncbi:membrane protein insertase YidC, partial [Agromyces sp. NPDC055658]
VPVFLGLYHVLMSFNRTQTGIGRLGLSVEENRSLANYVFSATDVSHFLDANLFGAPLGATMVQQHGLEAFTEFNRLSVVLVGVPIMILAGIATHFNSRASVARQSVEAAANPQTAMMNKLALYVFPLGVVVGGPFLPLAVIIYWLSNNIWTYGQQHYVFGMIEKEEEAKKAETLERRSANAPAPGAKPNKARKTDSASAAVTGDVAGAEADAKATQSEDQSDKAGGSAGPSVSRTPKPGARPKKRKR